MGLHRPTHSKSQLTIIEMERNYRDGEIRVDHILLVAGVIIC